VPEEIIWGAKFTFDTLEELETHLMANYRHIMIFVRTNISLYPPFSVANPDPGSGAFWTLDPGSGIGFFRTRIPISQTHIFDVPLITNFGV
jgi:hypothetical protein